MDMFFVSNYSLRIEKRKSLRTSFSIPRSNVKPLDLCVDLTYCVRWVVPHAFLLATNIPFIRSLVTCLFRCRKGQLGIHMEEKTLALVIVSSKCRCKKRGDDGIN
jgi:hypothetical protein